MKIKLLPICLALMALLYTSCSQKEVLNPVVNTARVDALRQELRDLQILVYGEELKNSQLKADNNDLQGQVNELTAYRELGTRPWVLGDLFKLCISGVVGHWSLARPIPTIHNDVVFNK